MHKAITPVSSKKIFGISKRSSDYAQALMEMGALICKPKNPLCDQSPLTKNCLSSKKNDFEINSKFRKKINKSFLVTCYTKDNKILLVKNNV